MGRKDRWKSKYLMELLNCLVEGIKKKVIRKDKNINLHHKHLLYLVTCISESLHSVSVLVLQTADGILLLCDFIQREAYSHISSKQTDTAFFDISNFLRGRKSLPRTLSWKVRNFAIVKVFIDELGVLNCKTIQFSCSCGCFAPEPVWENWHRRQQFFFLL